MKSLEKFSTIFLIAGVTSFLIAFLVLGLWPAVMTHQLDGNAGLPQGVPSEFKVYYSSVEQYHTALLRGRDLYIREACWHCHSQYVRPVSNESARYGMVSTAGEYENLLHLPQLFGTRRVGPDLIREAGKHSNDWHFAHLYNPKSVVPESMMPVYPWYFTEPQTDPQKPEEAPVPTTDGVALVAYLQALGSWAKDNSLNLYDFNEVTMPPEADEVIP